LKEREKRTKRKKRREEKESRGKGVETTAKEVAVFVKNMMVVSRKKRTAPPQVLFSASLSFHRKINAKDDAKERGKNGESVLLF
jgi:hypothetical protein